MGVYEPLTHYLRSLDSDSWNASFDEVERVLERDLPRSAYKHRPWWGNEQSGNHSQSGAWRDAGWETREVDLKQHRVRFERVRRQSGTASRQPEEGLTPLWQRAEEISGIGDRETLLRAALTAFIQREAARQLAAMGGSMPDFTVPPRERPEA